FSYVTLGDLRHFGNNDSLGQNAGCLGRAYDPFTLPFVKRTDGALDMGGVTAVLAEADGGRLGERRQVLERVARAAPAPEPSDGRRARPGRLHPAGLRTARLVGDARGVRPGQ